MNEVARPPQLDPVEARFLSQRNGALSLQLRAHDVDIPAAALRYSVSMEPAAASSPEVDERGLFSWQPASADLGEQYQITFKVSKASDDSLTAQQSMTVSLKPPPSAKPPAPTVATTPAPVPAPTTTLTLPSTPEPAPRQLPLPRRPRRPRRQRRKPRFPRPMFKRRRPRRSRRSFASSLPCASLRIGDRWPGSSCGKPPAPMSWPSATCC